MLSWLLWGLVAGVVFSVWWLRDEFGATPKAAVMQVLAKRSRHDGAVFANEEATTVTLGKTSAVDMIKEMFFPSSAKRRPSQVLPTEKHDLSNLKQQASSIVWFGHSSYLLTINQTHVLVDPVFSGRAAPFAGVVDSFKGSDVYSAQDMPNIDILLITHDHYDHLDANTVKALKDKVKRVIVPLGVGEHLKFWGYDAAKITELDWYQSTQSDGLSITSAPARHFSGRSFARNQTLWASYVIKGPEVSIYLGGDSGYGAHLKKLGDRFGPFDFALLESGQYNEDWPNIHMMPEETVQAAKDLKSRWLMPVHWGKFVLSLHDWDEPIERVLAAAEKQQQSVATPKIGQIMYLNQPPQTPWWRSL